MKIILIGFMGSGKTAVARCLGCVLQLEVFDTDAIVLKETGLSNMEEVFARGGELFLREMELMIAKKLAARGNCVIATGGGMVQNKIVLDYLRQQQGIVYFLNCPFELCKSRVQVQDARPLFKNYEAAEHLYDLRLPLYMNYADEIVNVDGKTVVEIAEEIAYGQ